MHTPTRGFNAGPESARRQFLALTLGGAAAALVGCSAERRPATARTTEPTTAITGARLFDGARVVDGAVVVIAGDRISAVGRRVPEGATVVDGRGATLLPGLIDAHTHTSPTELAAALSFGVTTELEMGNEDSADVRQAIAGRDDIADYRSAGASLAAPGGHPSELFGPGEPTVDFCQCGRTRSRPSTPAEAQAVVDDIVAGGADYIKMILEDGTVFGAPGVPSLAGDTVVAAVDAAHRNGKLALAHATTHATNQEAAAAGMDGTVHLFVDRPHTPELVDGIAAAGMFVVPTMTLNATLMGLNSAALADDKRVSSRLTSEWLQAMRTSANLYPQGDFAAALASVAALHAAGVDVLVGTDTSRPGGGAPHGAGVHQEMQFFVQAGLTPLEALAAATSVPARRFGLDDRGRIAPGARADLLLVRGDPTTTISDSLNTLAVWRRGTRLAA